MAMRAGSQGTSMVEQYFTHFAQQKFMGSSIAWCGQLETHSPQEVHLVVSRTALCASAAVLAPFATGLSPV
jgi:hypothetical protein